MNAKNCHLSLLAGTLCTVIGLYSADIYAAPKNISLSQGRYVGNNVTQGKVVSWLGIPYAQAPVGKLRWQSPKAPKPSRAKFDASQMGDVCPQLQKGQVIGHEDCLNLNVYRPNTDAQNLPVLVYIHGGNNQGGQANELNGAKLAHDINAVVVTFNYRLGALGFNPLKTLVTKDPLQASGNYGFLDQARLLDWVHANISQFGGNANNVTISGFSAGGRDVMAMLISPIFKNKFKQAIVFSGGMTTSPVDKSRQVFLDAFAQLVVKDGKQGTLKAAKQWLKAGGKDVNQYLYHLSAQKIVPLMQHAGIRMSVFPHLYQDGKVIPRDGFVHATYQFVPTMMLTGHDEFSIFALADPYFKNADWQHDVKINQDYQFVFKYGGMLYRLFNVGASAQRMYGHKAGPLYGGQFNYGSDVTVVGDKLKKRGSFHGVFLSLFDEHKGEKSFGDAFKSQGAKALGKIFKAHLASFIRTGHPDQNVSVRWKPWNKETLKTGQSLYVMDANHHHVILYRTEQTYSFADINRYIKADKTLPQSRKTQLLHHVLNGRWFSQSLDQSSGAKPLW